MKNKPDKKAMKEEYQIMYKKVLEFTETAGRGASQRSQTEETLSMVDKGKYPKKFAEASWDLFSIIWKWYWWFFIASHVMYSHWKIFYIFIVFMFNKFGFFNDNISFPQRFKKDVDSCFGKNGEKILDMSFSVSEINNSNVN